MLRKVWLFVFPVALFAAESRTHEFSPTAEAWLTGPLLTPSAVIVQQGHFNVEPYLFSTANTAVYTNQWKVQDVPTYWNLSWQIPIQAGINSWLDCIVQPAINWNKVDSQTHWSLGDLNVEFDFQLYRAPLVDDSWTPSIRFSLQETLPTGKYRNLDPNKRRTDVGGFGSWVTMASLGASKVVDLDGHFFVYRLNVNYSFYYTKVHLTGFNSYGGGFGTEGTLYPGPTVKGQIGLEYTLNQNWVLATDAQVVWGATDRFTGFPGEIGGDLLAKNPVMANIQYSLAPAIEYNWNANLGLIAGVWFTVAGKNSAKFTSGVIALNYYK